MIQFIDGHIRHQVPVNDGEKTQKPNCTWIKYLNR